MQPHYPTFDNKFMKTKKIILAFDSFKGSASAKALSDAAESAILDILPGCNVIKIPIADGGEGTVDAICRHAKVSHIECNTHDPLMRDITASYAIIDETKTAIIELAAASGLTLVEESHRNPLETTTYGTGELIADAIGRGCRKFIIGLGGSATNDGGTGMLAALGFRFKDFSGNDLKPIGKNLSLIASVCSSTANQLLKECSFTVACDVENPLYGNLGAAAIFAPQKGADSKMVEILDNGLRNFNDITMKATGCNMNEIAGSGAAGGAGGGMAAYLHADLKKGNEIILNIVNFDKIAADADLIITGEGHIDSQTMMGKAISGVLTHAIAANVPVIAIAGAVDDADTLNKAGLTAVFPIQHGPVSHQEAMDTTTTLNNAKRTVAQIIRLIDAFQKK